MAGRDSTALTVVPREPSGSRAVRRLRREGNVPGIVYGGDEEPITFAVDRRLLRNTLAKSGAVLDLSIEGSGTTPVVIKDLVIHPVSGETVHVDLLRVRLDEVIQATIVLELLGTDDAPGVKEGGVLELVTRELTIEALPNNIPDSMSHDVSSMVIGDTLTLEALNPPADVKLIDDPETVIATLSPPRLQLEADDGIESETEVVGEDEGEGEAGEGEAPAEQDSGGGDSDSGDE
jgi:large subunit ribosomal protein L25